MKNSSACPKCKASDVLRIEGKAGAYGSGNVVPIGWTIFSSVKVTRFLCVACGFSEEWIEDPEDIAKIVEAFR